MNNRTKRSISIFFLLVFTWQIFAPGVALALTGGPSQPEVQSFEPVGTSQLVDLFSGDFNYNIPLLDVDGYPINIAYHSGIGMDQEASWVGLGWNLNPGVVNRNLRGIPDDFNGDNIVKNLRLQPDETYGVNGGVGFELFGLDKWKFTSHKDDNYGTSIGLNLGVSYNNYRGLGFEFGIPIGYKFEETAGLKLSLGLNNSNWEGLTIQPGVGAQQMIDDNGLFISGGLGVNINSREGLQQVNVMLNPGVMGQFTEEKGYQFTADYGASINSFSTMTYTPHIAMPMSGFNTSLSIKVGPETMGGHTSVNLSGHYSKYELQDNSVARAAYGAQFLQNSSQDKDILDFNREKDGSVSNQNPMIGIPQLTHDLFSYSGQGTGGMFRAFRSDVPVLHDPSVWVDPSHGGSFGGEFGVGGMVKNGVDLMYNYSKSHSGSWKTSTGRAVFADQGLDYKITDPEVNPLYEPVYFKSVGERTPVDKSFAPFQNMDKNLEIRLSSGEQNFQRKLGGSLIGPNRQGVQIEDGNYYRNERDKRNSHIRVLSVDERAFCVQTALNNYEGQGPSSTISTLNRNSSTRKGHHNTEVTVTNPDGSRFVYGIAAYNNLQKEFSFTNAKEPDNTVTPTKFCETGEVQYDPDFDNFKGIDQYKEEVNTPAYAHSYLLTEVLSADYIDVDNNGPTPNDNGTYTRINYSLKNEAYKWRVPYAQYRANYDEGFKSDQYDDKGSFIYGEKEIWHVHSIEGKNHIAYFYTSARKDGHGVLGESGGRSSSMLSYKLDSIVLFSRYDQVTPIKTVVFSYDYYLCPNTPNNIDYVEGTDVANSGKLTLRKIYFKYGTSSKGKYNSYVFDYNGSDANYNAPYHLKGYDSWGNYKPAAINLSDGTPSTATCNENGKLLSTEFPYVNQDKTKADQYAAMWSLSKITLPTGGVIEVEYESDDYAYVQDKNAMQMYRLLGFGETSSSTPGSNLYSDNGQTNYQYAFLEVPLSATPENLKKGIDYLLFKVLMDIDSKGHYEYVRGYAKLLDVGVKSTGSTTKTVWAKLETVDLKNNSDKQIHVMSNIGFSFARLNLPFVVYPESNALKSGSSNLKDFGRALGGLFTSMVNKFRSQDQILVDKKFCRTIIPAKSWVRLNNTTGFKYGGGSRVKKIISSDNWAAMEGGGSPAYRTNKFTQNYNYTMAEGKNSDGSDRIISSGVASWEPIVGSDENPHKILATYFSKKKKFVPDDKYFSEHPYGESYFPAASVGYSHVWVTSGNDSYDASKFGRSGTGKVLSEFYTAKDFPTIVHPLDIQARDGNKKSIWTLIAKFDRKSLSVAQSLRIELNDMHGKPKAQWLFRHADINTYDISKAYSGTNYEYFESSDGGKRRLDNEVKVVSKNGTISTAMIGVESDLVMDTRHEFSYGFSGGIGLNLDAFTIGPIPIFVLTGIPKISSSESNVQTAAAVKIINRYGILKQVIAHEEGATIKTENTLFDGETGEVLVTKTQNEFEDHIYNTNYPSHWVYEGMGPAYKNQGALLKLVYNATTGFKVYCNGIQSVPDNFLYHGDLLKAEGSNTKYWVYYQGSGVWRLMDENGTFVSIPSNTVKVIASGRKNMQSMPVASFVQLEDPAQGDVIENETSVINASAMEFDSSAVMKNCFKPIVTTKCLTTEARDFMDYLFYKNYLNVVKLDSIYAYYPTTGKYISIDTTGLSSTDFFMKSEYKKLFNKVYAGNTNYRVKVYVSKSGSSYSNYNYDVRYVLDPIDIVLGCSRYIFRMEAAISTYLMSGTYNSPTYPIGGCNSSAYPANCNFTVNSTLNPYHTLDGIFTSNYLGYYGCDCYPSSNSGSIENYSDSGICFTGLINLYADKHGAASVASLPAPYSGFHNWNGISILRFVSDYNSLTSTYDTKYDARNFQYYITSQYYEENYCTQAPVVAHVNPFTSGIQNNWKAKRTWAYVDKRNPESGSTNVRSDGTYKTFTNFWQQNSSAQRPRKNVTDNWQFTKEITKYNPHGDELESKNALDVYSATLFGYNQTLPVAVGVNAKYNQLLAFNFESESGISNNTPLHVSCPAVHQMYDLQSSLIDTNYYHTGYSSYKVADTIRVSSSYVNNQISTLLSSASGYSSGYQTKAADHMGVFEPSTGKYYISAWVYVGNNPSASSSAGIQVITSTESPIFEGASSSGTTIVTLHPSGPVIDGWQKIDGTFELGSTKKTILIKLFPGTGGTVYMDDLRVQPFASEMKTYVYDTRSLKLAAELDENNFATFYEYDNEGNLVRVKKETERGIVTLKEVRSGFKKAE